MKDLAIRFPAPKSSLGFTGERYVPGVAGDIEHEHHHRYLFALQLCKGKRVLDVACGEGYGSALLAQVATSVAGVDIAADTVTHAKRNYSAPNLQFHQAAATRLPLDNASVDVVVSFETIEHFAQHDMFMAEIKRVLRPGGMLVMSSPNSKVYSSTGKTNNRYHELELSDVEFENLVRRYFTKSAFLGQMPVSGSLLMPLTPASTAQTRHFSRSSQDSYTTRVGPTAPLYVIALASDEELPAQIEWGLLNNPAYHGALWAEVEKRAAIIARVTDHNEKWRVTHEEDCKRFEALQLEREQERERHEALQAQNEQDSVRHAAELERFDAAAVITALVQKQNEKWQATHREDCKRFEALQLEREKDRERHEALRSKHENDRKRHIAELERFHATIEQLTQDGAAAHRAADLAHARLNAIRKSRSWRITTPMRFTGHLVHGDFQTAGSVIAKAGRSVLDRLPNRIRIALGRKSAGILSVTGVVADSSANGDALAAIVAERHAATRGISLVDPLTAALPAKPPCIDISVVTYNSSRWVASFVASLINLNYPKSLLTIRFVDNSSTDDTVASLESAARTLRGAGLAVEILQRPNRGFGAGHNAGIRAGKAPYCMVTNIDLTFDRDALASVVATALADQDRAASWELRQKPYEHPKFYDPVTGTTNWSSHACVLLRRSAFDRIGGFDETLFMYGEDVEFSYRLRRAGYVLRYCPRSSVIHHTYEHAGQVKELQYTGSTFANLYLRLKFGTWTDILAVPAMGMSLLRATEVFPGSRNAVKRSLRRLAFVAPKALVSRRRSAARFPFRTWDFEIIREGAFVSAPAILNGAPLVSIITRTYKGRDQFLRQALLSVAHQTYPAIEHIVVEDGGESMRSVVEGVAKATGRPIRFIPLAKVGRSIAGNAGLAASTGRWCNFLDDDDLLFGEHVEMLADTLTKAPDAVAAYALAWEVKTSKPAGTGAYSEDAYRIPPVLREPFDHATLAQKNLMTIQSVLFERTLFLERGGFDDDMDVLEDWILWNLYAYRNRFVSVGKLTSLFRTPLDTARSTERDSLFAAAHQQAVARIRERTAQYSLRALPVRRHNERLVGRQSSL